MLLETKSLWLKTTEMQDAEKLHSNYFTDFNTSQAMLWKPSATLQDTEKKLKLMFQTKESIFFTIIKKENKEPIGMLTITKNRSDEKIIDNIGFGFSSGETYKGYGLEVLLMAVEFCFSKLMVNEINVSYLKNIGISNNLQNMFGFEISQKGETEIKRKHTNEKLEVVNLTLTKEKWQMQKARLGVN